MEGGPPPEAIRYTPRGFGTMKARNLGRTYPYLSGSHGAASQHTSPHLNMGLTKTQR